MKLTFFKAVTGYLGSAITAGITTSLYSYKQVHDARALKGKRNFEDPITRKAILKIVSYGALKGVQYATLPVTYALSKEAGKKGALFWLDVPIKTYSQATHHDERHAGKMHWVTCAHSNGLTYEKAQARHLTHVENKLREKLYILKLQYSNHTNTEAPHSNKEESSLLL